MKTTALAAFFSSLILLIAVLVSSGAAPDPAQSSAPEARRLSPDGERSVTVLCDDKPVEMSAHDYLVGVLAAEMPATFEEEALKAQAVAARSYLERSMASKKHEDADICSSPDCCQAYLSKKALKKEWGKDHDKYLSRIEAAVTGTDGEYLSYDGEAALTAFHSSSAGATENSGEIWGELPYLVSVSSPETEDDVPGFVSRVKQSDLDFRDTILYLKPDADMTGDADTWVGKITENDSGRVESVKIGGVKFTGTEIRDLFSLRSTAFKIKHADGAFTFTVTGYGHGVGMSQYGAQTMAKSGVNYKEILSHYYPGTILVSRA